MIHNLTSGKDNLVPGKISGKIPKEEVQKVNSLIHEITRKNRKVDFYFALHGFHGYDLPGLWADLKVDAAHHSDNGNIGHCWGEKMPGLAVKVSHLFTSSEVKYFDFEDKEVVKSWIGL